MNIFNQKCSHCKAYKNPLHNGMCMSCIKFLAKVSSKLKLKG